MRKGKGMRKIVVDDVLYYFKVGKAHVLIRSVNDNSVRETPFCNEVMKMTPNEYERAMWKGTSYGVSPGYVEEWLRENVLNKG